MPNKKNNKFDKYADFLKVLKVKEGLNNDGEYSKKFKKEFIENINLCSLLNTNNLPIDRNVSLSLLNHSAFSRYLLFTAGKYAYDLKSPDNKKIMLADLSLTDGDILSVFVKTPQEIDNVVSLIENIPLSADTIDILLLLTPKAIETLRNELSADKTCVCDENLKHLKKHAEKLNFIPLMLTDISKEDIKTHETEPLAVSRMISNNKIDDDTRKRLFSLSGETNHFYEVTPEIALSIINSCLDELTINSDNVQNQILVDNTIKDVLRKTRPFTLKFSENVYNALKQCHKNTMSKTGYSSVIYLLPHSVDELTMHKPNVSKDIYTDIIETFKNDFVNIEDYRKATVRFIDLLVKNIEDLNKMDNTVGEKVFSDFRKLYVTESRVNSTYGSILSTFEAILLKQLLFADEPILPESQVERLLYLFSPHLTTALLSCGVNFPFDKHIGVLQRTYKFSPLSEIDEKDIKCLIDFSSFIHKNLNISNNNIVSQKFLKPAIIDFVFKRIMGIDTTVSHPLNINFANFPFPSLVNSNTSKSIRDCVEKFKKQTILSCKMSNAIDYMVFRSNQTSDIVETLNSTPLFKLSQTEGIYLSCFISRDASPIVGPTVEKDVLNIEKINQQDFDDIKKTFKSISKESIKTFRHEFLCVLGYALEGGVPFKNDLAAQKFFYSNIDKSIEIFDILEKALEEKNIDLNVENSLTKNLDKNCR